MKSELLVSLKTTQAVTKLKKQRCKFLLLVITLKPFTCCQCQRLEFITTYLYSVTTALLKRQMQYRFEEFVVN